MEVNGIYRSCSSGETFRAIPDVASLASPSCLLLTLPGEAFPIIGILFSPFRFHQRDSLFPLVMLSAGEFCNPFVDVGRV